MTTDDRLEDEGEVGCGTLGCENTIEDGSNYCEDCLAVSPALTDDYGGETEENDDALKAFTCAIEYFQNQLDIDLPDDTDHDTPRDHYQDGRGWTAETIDEKRLGFAPTNYKDDLIVRLFDRGFDRETILATGLFDERDDGNLYATWSGRYVLPYFDEGGQPVFAISRATDPIHPGDWKGNKYDKIQMSCDGVEVDEPIYGLETIRDGEPVLITEGIADAITAHQHGYPCVSPVTTRFKHDDREQLLYALEGRNVPRVYIIQDAERPTSDINDKGRLTVKQFGEGTKGAVDTAAYLVEHEIDARVGELPRPGLEKVDLDDYLQGWSDDLTSLLASANPVDQHPAYDDATARDVALDATKANDLDTDGDHSALFDLDIRDVTGLSWGHRGPNPLGHHGESENYFVLIREHGVAYDHKHKAVYNALTYLLCEAGERRPSRPNGSLTDREVFVAWAHAKREGCIPATDPIPHRALRHVALEAEICNGDDIEDGWRLPADAYNGALEVVADDHGIEPGREPLGKVDDGTSEPVGVLPESPKARAAAQGWSWGGGAANRDRSLAPSQEDVYGRTTAAIGDVMGRRGQAVIDAIMGGGKTFSSFTAARERDEPLAYFAPRGELYEQGIEYALENGYIEDEIHVLPSGPRDCPTFKGEHGDAARKRVWTLFNRGVTPKAIHNLLGDDLPCCDNEDGKCVYEQLLEFDPEEYEVIIGHYKHAHLPHITGGRHVVVDENPTDAFLTRIEGEQLIRGVNAFLSLHDSPPLTG